MRIRSIKPEFWRSLDIVALPWNERLLFIGLWSYVDDNGVGRDIEKLIVADLFPMEENPRDTLATVSRGLQNLSEAGLIVRYSTPDGRPYLYITGWEHQRIDKPAKARYPLPTSEDTTIRDTLATPSRQSPDTLAPGTGEQGNRGTGEVVKDSSPSAQQFEAFWAIYPRKVAKPDAVKAYAKAIKTVDENVIVLGAHRYASDPNRDPQFTAHPATWINRHGWQDDPLPPRRDGNPTTGQKLSTADERLLSGRALTAHFEAQEQATHRPQIGA